MKAEIARYESRAFGEAGEVNEFMSRGLMIRDGMVQCDGM